jgi:hypothetical protein
MTSMFRARERINLDPAAPIRLATMLNAWIIAEMGWGNLSGGTFGQADMEPHIRPTNAPVLASSQTAPLGHKISAQTPQIRAKANSARNPG